MNKFIVSNLILIFVITFINVHASASSKQIIAGAGPSTKIVQKFATSFGKLPETVRIEFIVPPKSSKHKGGINSSDHNLFGRTGRPLNEKEKALNKDEIILARVPIAIVVGKGTGIKKLTLSQLESITSGEVTNWKDVGGTDNEITYIGREATEALFSVLKQDYNFFEQAKFKLTFKKDNHVVDYFKNNPSSQFAIGFGALPNFIDVSEIHIVDIDGFESGVSLGLVYDLNNKEHPVVLAAKKHAQSQAWQDIVIQDGLLPAK